MTDNMIDDSTAKYWCIFCRSTANVQRTIAESIEHDLRKRSNINEGVVPYMTSTSSSSAPVEKFVDTMKEITSRPKNELQYIMHGLPDDTAVEVANNTLNELRKNGPDVAETIAAELGQAYGPNDAV